MSAHRPTPETDASIRHVTCLSDRAGLCRSNYDGGEVAYVPPDFARRLERERDEAREIAKKYEDRYFTMSELRNNASIVALQYKAQRDLLLGALIGVLEEWEGGYRPEDCGTTMAIAREAIAEVGAIR